MNVTIRPGGTRLETAVGVLRVDTVHRPELIDAAVAVMLRHGLKPEQVTQFVADDAGAVTVYGYDLDEHGNFWFADGDLAERTWA